MQYRKISLTHCKRLSIAVVIREGNVRLENVQCRVVIAWRANFYNNPPVCLGIGLIHSDFSEILGIAASKSKESSLSNVLSFQRYKAHK
jgi:hypothetical protein